MVIGSNSLTCSMPCQEDQAPLLEEAVKKMPNNPTYRYHLGMVYEKLNDSAKAKSAFEAAIKAKPDSPAAESARKALSELAGT